MRRLAPLVLLVSCSRPPLPAPDGMVWIEGGTFGMGSADGAPDERPVHRESVGGFWLDRTEVTNAEFARFVAATGYVTVAERLGTSLVFVPRERGWWQPTTGASWRHPLGPGSIAPGKHPVVHVAWEDADAYARWAGKRLPTEAEWEFAARGSRPGNIWQGRFPIENTCDDGFAGTAPVGSFPANERGLADMAGNVWEWCADAYRRYDEPSGGPNRAMRGGSFVCSEGFCTGYRPTARMKSSPDSSFSHTGFRCAKSPS
jgi:formylglycine-generating enzyme required for sulfatase activity